jgi:hypothetical protein
LIFSAGARFAQLTELREPDHFLASIEPDRRQRRPKHSGKPPAFRQNMMAGMEQKAFVAAPSQLRTITAPALARGNQNEATLFDLNSLRNNGDQ